MTTITMTPSAALRLAREHIGPVYLVSSAHLPHQYSYRTWCVQKNGWWSTAATWDYQNARRARRTALLVIAAEYMLGVYDGEHGPVNPDHVNLCYRSDVQALRNLMSCWYFPRSTQGLRP